MTIVKDASRVISRTMSLEHVKSHQDTKSNFNKLPFAAQLNTICDRMATRHGIPSKQRIGSTKRVTSDQEHDSKIQGTRLSLLTMSVDCVPTFTVPFSKPSITGVTNSGTALPGTPSKWWRDVLKRTKLSIRLSSSTIG